MKQVTIPSWKFGLDSRKEDLTGLSGTLQRLEDCFVNSGGEIEKRKGFFNLEVLNFYDSLNHLSCFGLESTLDGLVVFGHAAPYGATPLNSEPTLLTQPQQVVYQQLRHPALINDVTEVYVKTRHRITSILFSISYKGKAFVAAVFADGNRFLYYDGTLIQHSANGLVMTGRVGLDDIANDLVRQVQAIEWTASANSAGDAVKITGITRLAQVATATTEITHGYTTGNSVEIVGALEPEYLGIYTITVTSTTQFTYTIVGAPVAIATTLDGMYSIKQSVTQNGAVTIKAPAGEFVSIIPSESSTAGYIGVKKIHTNNLGTNGTQASAGFDIDNCDGTFTLEAPDNGTAATPTIDLCGGAVTSAGADSAVNRVLTAQKIVQAVNDLTFAHGYSALSNSNAVFIFAPISYGAFGFNLTVTPTTGAVSSTALLPTSLTVYVTPNDLVFTRISPANFLGNFGGTLVSVVAGGTAPYTYVWSAISNPSNLVIGTNTQATTTIGKFFTGSPQSASGNFKLEVTDATGTKQSFFFTVTVRTVLP